MNMHTHQSTPDRHYFPIHNCLLASHPACRACGAIKNISPDRGKRLGYYINILTGLRGYKGEKLLSEVQVRLITRGLQKKDFDDAYSITGTAQRDIFFSTVRRYSNLSVNFIESFLQPG